MVGTRGEVDPAAKLPIIAKRSSLFKSGEPDKSCSIYRKTWLTLLMTGVVWQGMESNPPSCNHIVKLTQASIVLFWGWIEMDMSHWSEKSLKQNILLHIHQHAKDCKTTSKTLTRCPFFAWVGGQSKIGEMQEMVEDSWFTHLKVKTMPRSSRRDMLSVEWFWFNGLNSGLLC